MLRDILRFYRQAPRLLTAADDGLTLAAYLDREGYAPDFVENHLYPVTAAIWSSPHARMGRYPRAGLSAHSRRGRSEAHRCYRQFRRRNDDDLAGWR